MTFAILFYHLIALTLQFKNNILKMLPVDIPVRRFFRTDWTDDPRYRLRLCSLFRILPLRSIRTVPSDRRCSATRLPFAPVGKEETGRLYEPAQGDSERTS